MYHNVNLAKIKRKWSDKVAGPKRKANPDPTGLEEATPHKDHPTPPADRLQEDQEAYLHPCLALVLGRSEGARPALYQAGRAGFLREGLKKIFCRDKPWQLQALFGHSWACLGSQRSAEGSVLRNAR